MSNNILRTSIISVGAFSLGAILVVLSLENNNSSALKHTISSGNNTSPPPPLLNSIKLDQQNQQNKIDELIASLNIVREEVAYIGGQQQKILEQQREIEKTEDQPQFNEPLQPADNEVLNNPEPVISDAEFQVELEQKYAMYDSLYQSGEDDQNTAIRVQDAFQVMETNNDIDVGAVNCSENICRMQTIVANSDIAEEFVNKFPEILPWGTQAVYFITVQTDGSAQVTHFFATEGIPLPEYLDEQSG